jgi:hypothetical protein
MSDMLLISTGYPAGRTCDRQAKERHWNMQCCTVKEGGHANEVAASTPPSTDSGSDRIKWSSDVGQGHPYGSSGDAKRAWKPQGLRLHGDVVVVQAGQLRGTNERSPHNLQIATLTGHAAG